VQHCSSCSIVVVGSRSDFSSSVTSFLVELDSRSVGEPEPRPRDRFWFRFFIAFAFHLLTPPVVDLINLPHDLTQKAQRPDDQASKAKSKSEL
jgi:hypothetical protein